MQKYLSEYDEILISLIPKLNQYKCVSGSEGTVYFVDDNFVVKEYFSSIKKGIFNNYCEEFKSFNNQGLALPKIYALVKRNNKSYILEERIHGNMLFDTSPQIIYKRCESFCSQDEFQDAVFFPKNNNELLSEIKKEYIKTYLETNVNLNLMLEENIENFIKSNYELGKNCKYTCPDLQPSNLLFDDKNLTIIDLALVKNFDFRFYNKIAESMLMRDFITLFQSNNHAYEHANYICKDSDILKKLAKENQEACFEAMRRFVKKTNEMYSLVNDNKYDFYVCEHMARRSVGEKLAKEICSEIQREL